MVASADVIPLLEAIVTLHLSPLSLSLDLPLAMLGCALFMFFAEVCPTRVLGLVTVASFLADALPSLVVGPLSGRICY